MTAPRGEPDGLRADVGTGDVTLTEAVAALMGYGGHSPRATRFVADLTEWLDARLRAALEERDRNDAAHFTAWASLPCTRCGGQRNYRCNGHLQVVCHSCAHPAPSPSGGPPECDVACERLIDGRWAHVPNCPNNKPLVIEPAPSGERPYLDPECAALGCQAIAVREAEERGAPPSSHEGGLLARLRQEVRAMEEDQFSSSPRYWYERRKQIIATVKKRHKSLAAERDALCDLRADIEGIEADADEALEGLDTVIEALSRLQ